MSSGTVTALCICPTAGAPMQLKQEVEAIAGEGLKGDRYARGDGSYNRGRQGKRQVTLINACFVYSVRSSYTLEETRRNICVNGVELMDQIGHEFKIGDAVFRGVKYCDPCNRPTKLAEKTQSFQYAFWDCGGLIAEVVVGGIIRVGSLVVPRKKDY